MLDHEAVPKAGQSDLYCQSAAQGAGERHMIEDLALFLCGSDEKSSKSVH